VVVVVVVALVLQRWQHDKQKRFDCITLILLRTRTINPLLMFYHLLHQ